MAMEFDLIPPGTRVEANGKGARVDVRPSETRIFFLVMEITDQVEQESVDVSIEGSADGEAWTELLCELIGRAVAVIILKHKGVR